MLSNHREPEECQPRGLKVVCSRKVRRPKRLPNTSTAQLDEFAPATTLEGTLKLRCKKTRSPNRRAPRERNDPLGTTLGGRVLQDFCQGVDARRIRGSFRGG